MKIRGVKKAQIETENVMNGNAIKNVAGLLLCDVVCIRHHRAKPEWHTRLHLFRHISKKFLSVAPLQPANFCFI